jgi:predicted nucleic acid-binding protein
MDNVFIDTDVILDFFFDRKPFSDFAAMIFSLCESKLIQGFVTPVIFSNVYYILRRTAKHQYVINKLIQLLKITDILIIDREVIFHALNSEFADFEDALQYNAAYKYGEINIILTRNIKDFKNSKLAVMTPENYLKSKI